MSTEENKQEEIKMQEHTLELTLSQTFRGETVLENPVCKFHYHWDFENNTGSASLATIDGVEVEQKLFPLGIKGMLGFMSDMQPTLYMINDKQVSVFRIILDIDLPEMSPRAAIMFNKDGSTIQTTDNWDASKENLTMV